MDKARDFGTRIMNFYTGSFEKNTIEYWQCYIFYILAFAGTVFGTLSLLFGLIVLIPKGQTAACIFLALGYAVNVLFILAPRISFRIKTVVIAINFYLFGVASLLIAGPIGESGIWFSVSLLTCSLFIGLRFATGFAIVNFLTGVVFGVLHVRGILSWQYFDYFPLHSWILQSGNILLVGMIFVIANTTLIWGVGKTFRDLNKAESNVQASLAEKETLIRELYHRTKNNMQIVSSLLTLHSRQIESEEARTVFRDINNKIISMSLVHQKLYESRNLSNIDLADYIKDLVDLLFTSYGVSRDRIRVEMKLDHKTMLIDTAIPCALVISEIITNSLKYAFPGGRKGCLHFTLEACDDDILEIVIADDGIGLPEGFDPSIHGKMGMKTLFAMVERQLNGSIGIKNDGGLEYRLRFKANLYSERMNGV